VGVTPVITAKCSFPICTITRRPQAAFSSI